MICSECNKPISIAEEQFLRSSPEAFQRLVHGIKGRSYHKVISPFYRGSAGASPIVIKYPYPETDYEILWEILPGTKKLNALRQIGMSIDNGEVIPIPLPQKIKSKADLLKYLRKHKLEKSVPVYFFTDPEDWESFQRILLQIWPEKKVKRLDVPRKTRKVYARTTFSFTSRYFRAIAKIGFHYFLSVFPHRFTGSEPEFGPIRSFIRDGEGEAEDFILHTERQIIGDLARGFTTKTWGHILTAEIKERSLVSKLQFFVGPENIPPVFEIELGSNPNQIICPESYGHFYSYYPDGPEEGYDGKLIRIRLVKGIYLPK